jgi:hypothetical protein
MLDDLHEQRPKIAALMSGGDARAYEYQLVRDYCEGLFRSAENAYALPEYVANVTHQALSG